MYQVIIVFHVLLGLSIIGLVLMQQGKGADAGAAFGSGSSGSVFGAQGATTFLSRTTAIFAVLFFSTSLGLAVYSGHKDAIKSFMDGPEEIEIVEEQPMADVPDIGNEVPMKVPSISDQQAVEEIDNPLVAEKPETIDDVDVIQEPQTIQENAQEQSPE